MDRPVIVSVIGPRIGIDLRTCPTWLNYAACCSFESMTTLTISLAAERPNSEFGFGSRAVYIANHYLTDRQMVLIHQHTSILSPGETNKMQRKNYGPQGGNIALYNTADTGYVQTGIL